METSRNEETSRPRKLSAKKQKAIEGLLLGKKKYLICEEIGIVPSTLSKWQKQPEFQEELEKQRELILEKVRDNIAGLANKCCEVLMDDLSDYADPKQAANILQKISSVIKK